MKLTGISDEAGAPIETQIRAHQELGWDTIESRFLQVGDHENGSFHEVPEEASHEAAGQLDAAGIRIAGVGSTIGNWAHSIEDDFQITVDEVERCIERMTLAGSKIVRIMSYAVLSDDDGNDLPDQLVDERLHRMREVTKRFVGAGITPVHENCMNYGGMSIPHALEVLDAVPDLQWVFDTCNPIFNEDRSKPGTQQDPWAFWKAVKGRTTHIHIKDGVYVPEKKDCDYTFPGDGEAKVKEILQDAKNDGFDGYVSIEPHMSVVFHDAGGDESTEDPKEKAQRQFDNYVEYGRRLERLVANLD